MISGRPKKYDAGDTIGRGSYGDAYTRFTQFLGRASVGYKKLIKDIHDLDVKAVTEYTRRNKFVCLYRVMV